MAISRRNLDDGESVVVSTRIHAKALVRPLLVLILLAAVAGLLGTLTSGAGRAAPLLQLVIWLLAAALAVPWVVRPTLTWLTTSYTLTDHRLISRRGILSRRGHDIPLAQVSEVGYERGLLDRVLGCGTLLVSVAGERRVELHDIPQVEQVHLRLQDLVHDGELTRAIQRSDDGRR